MRPDPVTWKFRGFPGMAARLFLAVALALATMGWAAGPPAQAASSAQTLNDKLDSGLLDALAGLAAEAPVEVVIVFSDLAAVPRLSALASNFIQMQALPMAGAVLTRSQIESLAGWPEIYSITLNTPLEYFLAESVPLVKADQVWTSYGQTGGNVTVAVIDTGIDATHPDLLLGVKVIQNVKVLPFETYVEDMPNTDTSSGHGTHVAGTVAGNGLASDGYYRGVAPDAKLVGLGAGEALSVLTAVQSYDWVLQNHEQYNIRVINNSWGSTGGDINVRNPIVIATFEAYTRGILSVFAAGNSGSYDVLNPYSLAPWVLSVAAGRKDGTLADFSSRGADGNYFKHPDITAPGVSIYAARSRMPGAANLELTPNPVNPLWTPHYMSISGTSMATPHVAGGAALVFSSNPQLSPDQVMDLLISAATPMPGYHLHEAGYGFMDVLAAYEASRSLAGNMPAFLDGQRQHAMSDVHAFDPDMPVEYQEILFTGITPAGATLVSAPINHPFDVPDGTLYVDVLLTWSPQVQDAYDIEVLDPEGRVVVSSGNGLEEPEAALFVPAMPGRYTLRIYPFAAVAAQYEARVKIAAGTPPADWPPSQPPQYDLYLGVNGIYKTYGLVLGIISEHFSPGDEVWINFALKDAQGLPVTGAAGQLQVILTDRLGNQIASGPGEISSGSSGAYSYFSLIGNNWNHMVAGPITVSFAYAGGGSLRAVDTRFFLNHLDVALNTGAAAYQPGQTISFNGSVRQVTTVAGGDLQTTPLSGAQVTISLRDAEGNRLASTQALTNLFGNYTGSLVAPGSTRGQTVLVAEATYQNPATVIGPSGWFGQAAKPLSFPGNQPPSGSVYATPTTSGQAKFLVHIQAIASDPDGASDITSAWLVLRDDAGRALKTWGLADFTAVDGHSLMLEAPYRVSGKAPWTVTLTVSDDDGASASSTATIRHQP
jgi:serine protease AprX